jgi:hypothetical protein
MAWVLAKSLQVDKKHCSYLNDKLLSVLQDIFNALRNLEEVAVPMEGDVQPAIVLR